MQKQTGSGAVSALVGFACGVGAALLFARKPGKETRQDIADMLDKGRRKGEEMIEKGRGALGKAKESVTGQGGKEPFYESGKYT